MAQHGAARPAGAAFQYSNLGVGLLGQGLADCAGTAYPNLIAKEITGPLGMHDTAVHLSPEQQARFIQGHLSTHEAAVGWDLDALAGAGAIRSTVADMLIYLKAN